MSGYFGTDEQQSLQALSEQYVGEILSTPGLCQNGRMLGCDHIEQLGWPTILAILDRDGFIGFRLARADQKAEAEAKLSAKGYRLDTWDLFIARHEEAVPLCERLVGRGLPDGLAMLPRPSQPEDIYTRRIQELIASVGVVPFSGSLLVGEVGPALTVVLGKDEDIPVAAAHGYLPHNLHSRFHRYAWGGLVAVDEDYRGQGLGTFINAQLALAVFNEFGASHLYEMISSTNVTSRRMAEACGLRHDPAYLCGAVTRADRSRYTR